MSINHNGREKESRTNHRNLPDIRMEQDEAPNYTDWFDDVFMPANPTGQSHVPAIFGGKHFVYPDINVPGPSHVAGPSNQQPFIPKPSDPRRQVPSRPSGNGPQVHGLHGAFHDPSQGTYVQAQGPVLQGQVPQVRRGQSTQAHGQECGQGGQGSLSGYQQPAGAGLVTPVPTQATMTPCPRFSPISCYSPTPVVPTLTEVQGLMQTSFDKMAVWMGEMAQVLNTLRSSIEELKKSGPDIVTRTTNCHCCGRSKATSVSLGCPLVCLVCYHCKRAAATGLNRRKQCPNCNVDTSFRNLESPGPGRAAAEVKDEVTSSDERPDGTIRGKDLRLVWRSQYRDQTPRPHKRPRLESDDEF